MATIDPRTVVKTTSRLWSEEVAVADASVDPLAPANDKAYVFNNGRTFITQRNYYPANSEPADNPPGA